MYSFRNSVDNLADDFIKSLPCHIQKPYPSAKMTFQNKQVAEMLLSAYANGGNSEMSAIAQYISHHETIEDENVSDSIFCIALVEMLHLDMIGTLIQSLGGDLRFWQPNHFYWSGGYVNYGNSLCEKLSLDIVAEQEAISGYSHLLREVNPQNIPSLRQVEAVLQRIKEDEEMHLNLFIEMYSKYCGNK